MPINVISPHASHYLGGMEVVTIEMARYLSRNGVSVRFFTRKVTKKSDLFRQLLKEASSTLTIQEVTLPASTPLPDGNVDISYTKNPTEDCKYYSLNGFVKVNFPSSLSGTMSFKSFNGDLFTNIDPLENMPPVEAIT